MDRLYETLRLESDNLNFLARMGCRILWEMPTVSPCDVYLSRYGTSLMSSFSPFVLDALVPWFPFQFPFVPGFLFQEDDLESKKWFPQGISSTGDADKSGKVDGEKYLLVAWYNDSNVGGSLVEPHARVSLINVSNPYHVTYRHLLLVNPIFNEDGRPSFEAVDSHCGGIVWFGRWLYVASNSTLRVFDMEAITDIKGQYPDYADSDYIGYLDGKYQAAGYRYIVPQVAIYTIVDEHRGKYFDTLSLDQSTDPPRLVAAAYINTNPELEYDKDLDNAVVVFFDLDPSSGLLASSAGIAEASDAAYTGQQYIQGVHARGDTVWFSLGTIFKLIRRKIGSDSGDEYGWAIGNEGITFFPNLDELWTVTEKEGARVCFYIYRDWVW